MVATKSTVKFERRNARDSGAKRAHALRIGVAGSLVALSLLVAPLGAQTMCIEAQRVTPLPDYVLGMASGDFDSDGDVDLATTGNTLQIVINDGDGVLGVGAAYPLLAPFARELEAVDLDGDGDLDLANTATSNTVHVRFNLGGGVFAAPAFLTVGFNPHELEAGDLDGDGDVDLVAGGSSLSVLQNLGGGTFAPAVSYPVGVFGLELGDMDLDGDLDVLVGRSSTVLVLANQGAGTFMTSWSIPTWYSVIEVAAGDLDGDGDLDLVAPDTYNEIVTVVLNLGGGGFATPTHYWWGSEPTSVRLVDLDVDGDLDAVVGYSNESALSLHFNQGNGTFAGATWPITGFGPLSCVIEDLDGDGDLDLAAANNGGSISTLRGCRISGRPMCAGDGSGTPCPCGNDSVPGENTGCVHSGGLAGRLRGEGSARLALDGLVLRADQMTAQAACLYLQGTTLENGGAGVLLGDGLLCVGGALVRLGIATNAAGASHYPGPGHPTLSVRGAVLTPGVRVYQTWYRNAGAYCAPGTNNTTNALRVLWAP